MITSGKNKSEKTRKTGITKKANPLKDICSSWLRQLAQWMEHHTTPVSLKAKKLVLICLIITGGIYSFIQVSSAFNKAYDSQNYSITSMSIPRHVNDNAVVRHPVITKKEFNRIHRYHLFLDSLAHNSSGHAVYDSIVNSRPGFIDSIRIIENIYQSQLKK